MRSVYREALRIRKPVHREPTNEELELAECTSAERRLGPSAGSVPGRS